MKKLTKNEIMQKLEKNGFFNTIWEACPGLDINHYFEEAFYTKENKILINISGHDTFTFQVKDIKNPNSIIEVVEEIIKHITLNKIFFEACKNGNSILVLPALPTLNAMILSAYHGIFGYFPSIKWYVKDKNGFNLTNSDFDLQKLRDEFRKKRTQLF